MLAFEHGNYAHRSPHHLAESRKLSSRSESHRSGQHSAHRPSTEITTTQLAVEAQQTRDDPPAEVVQELSRGIPQQSQESWPAGGSGSGKGSSQSSDSACASGSGSREARVPTPKSSTGGSTAGQPTFPGTEATNRGTPMEKIPHSSAERLQNQQLPLVDQTSSAPGASTPLRLSAHLETAAPLTNSHDIERTISNSSASMYKPSTSTNVVVLQGGELPSNAYMQLDQQRERIIYPVQVVGSPATTSVTTTQHQIGSATVMTSNTVHYPVQPTTREALQTSGDQTQPQAELARLVARASSSSQSLYKPSVAPRQSTSIPSIATATTRASTPTTVVTTASSLPTTPGTTSGIPSNSQAGAVSATRTMESSTHYKSADALAGVGYSAFTPANASAVTTSEQHYTTAATATTPLANVSAQQSSSTGYYSSSHVTRGEERVIGYNTIVQEDRIISERIVEHEVKVPKKIVREEVIEKVYVVPETIIREEIVEEIQKVQETIVEVAKPVIQEKIVEVPEIEYREKIVEKVEKIVQEKVVEIPKIEYQERTVEVPKVVMQEKIVEVPQIEYKDVVREKIVEVPEIRDEVVVREIPVPQYVDRQIPEYVDVEIPTEMERVLPVPVEAVTTFEYQLAQFRPRMNKVQYPLYVPRFVEVPISAELFDANTVTELEADASKLQVLTGSRAPGLCDVEGLALDFVKKDIGLFASELSPSDLQAALTNAWKNGQLSSARSAVSPVMHQQVSMTTTRGIEGSQAMTRVLSQSPSTTTYMNQNATEFAADAQPFQMSRPSVVSSGAALPFASSGGEMSFAQVRTESSTMPTTSVNAHSAPTFPSSQSGIGPAQSAGQNILAARPSDFTTVDARRSTDIPLRPRVASTQLRGSDVGMRVTEPSTQVSPPHLRSGSTVPLRNSVAMEPTMITATAAN